MAYEPHVWVDKEVITAEKLNNLEEGAKAKSIPGPQGTAAPGRTGTEGRRIHRGAGNIGRIGGQCGYCNDDWKNQ